MGHSAVDGTVPMVHDASVHVPPSLGSSSASLLLHMYATERYAELVFPSLSQWP